MEFVGILLKKLAEREGVSANGHWKIASYLLVTVEQNPRYMAVDVSNGEYADRIKMFDALVGKNVKVAFEINAREYQGKWYNGIRAFGIKEHVVEAVGATGATATAGEKPEADDSVTVTGANGGQRVDASVTAAGANGGQRDDAAVTAAGANGEQGLDDAAGVRGGEVAKAENDGLPF